MASFDPRVLVLVPVLLTVAACGADEPADPAPATSSAAASPVAPPSATDPSELPEPSGSVYEEEEPDPTAAPGDLPDEAQSYLDQALGIELSELQSAPAATAAQKREVLDRLPDNPTQVLAALKNYQWLSAEAKDLYDQAVAAS
jgi:hypothetical protein